MNNWAQFGPFCRHRGAFWTCLGAVLGASWERLGGVLGTSWGARRPSWGVLKPFANVIAVVIKKTSFVEHQTLDDAIEFVTPKKQQSEDV